MSGDETTSNAAPAGASLSVSESDRPAAPPPDGERYVWFVPAFFVVAIILIVVGVLFSPWAQRQLPQLVASVTAPKPESVRAPEPPKAAPAAVPIAVTAAPAVTVHPVAETFGLSPEAASSTNNAVRQAFDVLQREPCDPRALERLVKVLDGVSLRRDGAKAQVGYSRRCGGHFGFLFQAANTYMELADHKAAIGVAEEMIAGQPHDGNGFYFRGLSLAKLGDHQRAVDDFMTTLSLAGVRISISSGVFLALATSQEALGYHCDAAGTIEHWVAIDAPNRDTSQTRTMITRYDRQGSCAANAKGQRDTFPLGGPNRVAIVPAYVNGVRGQFIVDTGASYVALSARLAEQAGVEIDNGSSVMVQTANGVIRSKRGRADEVRLRNIAAAKVPVLVQETGFGPNVDGLLGMSFLSRFEVVISGGTVRISQKTGR
jgi:aspartyl protease family protein